MGFFLIFQHPPVRWIFAPNKGNAVTSFLFIPIFFYSIPR